MQEDHSDDAALAGEYALHLLDADERRSFEERLAVEPHLRHLVATWEEQLAQLSEDVAPVTPPDRIKSRIEEALFSTAKAKSTSRWGWFAGLGLAAALAVIGVFLVPFIQTPPSPAPTYIAELAAEDESLIVFASFFPDQRRLQVDRRSGAAASGRALELWLIAEGAASPVSLGVLSQETTTRIEIPDPLAAQIAGGTLAISDEPLGGSPTGAPTGAVLAAGLVAKI